MHSRPPPTTGCTRSRDGSSAMGMPRKMRSRMRSSVPGGIFAVFVTATGSMPGSIDSSSTPAPTRSRRSRRRRLEMHGRPDRSTRSMPGRSRSGRGPRRDRAGIPRTLPSSTARCSSLPTTSACRPPRSRRSCGIPTGTVYSRLHHGSRAMRASLGRSDLGAAAPPRSTDDERVDGSSARRLAARGAGARALAKPWNDALAATRRTSQRPGWTFLERWLPMQLTMQRTPVDASDASTSQPLWGS